MAKGVHRAFSLLTFIVKTEDAFIKGHGGFCLGEGVIERSGQVSTPVLRCVEEGERD